MFNKSIEKASVAAENKVNLLKKNPAGYFLLSVLAGMFIGFGVLLAYSIGAQLNGASYSKLLIGVGFCVGLSLVMMCGAELFTGNNLVMTIGIARKKVSLGNTLYLWLFCWIGNLLGSMLIAYIFSLTGLQNGATGEFMANLAVAKSSLGIAELISRGILCNMIVCMSVWYSFKADSDTAKLIMVFWVIFAFITTGYENCISNMTLFTEVLLNPCGQIIQFTGMLKNLLFVTIGNMIGAAIFTAFPYLIASKNE